MKEINDFNDIFIGKWYHVQHIGFESLTRVLQAYEHCEGIKALDTNSETIWLDAAHEKEVFSKFLIRELPEFDNLKLTRRDKAIARLRTNEALEEELIEKDKVILELAIALNEAADDIVDCANYYNNDSTMAVTEAHDEADKHRKIVNKYLK